MSNRIDWLDEREFYEQCQIYRHAPITDPRAVVNAFEALKGYIRKHDSAAEYARRANAYPKLVALIEEYADEYGHKVFDDLLRELGERPTEAENG